MLRPVLDHLWTHDSSRVPGASYTAPGLQWHRVDLKNWTSNLKKLRKFQPEFVLISAGFDSHFKDPLAQFKLETEDFYTITERILKTSKSFCSGKVVSILEGGYDLGALRDSTKRHVDALIEFD